MKNKISLLIITSIVALIALSSIQAYLVAKAYESEKKAFLKETDDAISDIHKKKELDSLFVSWGDDLKNHITDYLNGRISKGEVIKRFKNKADSSNTTYNELYNRELKALNLGYEVNYKTVITGLTIFRGKTTDSVLPSANQKTLKLFGQDFSNEDAKLINTAQWFSDHDFILQDMENITSSVFDLEVKTERYMLIKDWKSIVFKRMAVLLIVSVLIFLFVIGLLYYSIKNLINQKKIAEIKTDFINNITHELKTPLATLSVATKSLKNEKIKANPPAFDNSLNSVERQNNRLQKLIDQVLTNSLSSEDIVLSKESVLDNAYFDELIHDFKLSVQNTDLIIKNEVYALEVMLRIDRFHFTTALLNILENAVKYGKEHTEITIKTTLKNGNYHIYIMDNGIGILEKNQKHIFDKFYRVGEGNVHDVKGLGLGLYYTKQIVKAHNGTISIESELSKGTTFQIKIPVN